LVIAYYAYHHNPKYCLQLSPNHLERLPSNSKKQTKFVCFLVFCVFMRLFYVNRLIDEDTGEILSEEEMREFDGDIYEPQGIDEPEPFINQTIPKEVFALFGNKVEVR